MVTYSSKSAEESANIANMYAKVLQKYINDHVQIDVPVLISSAQVPESPSHPNKVMILEWGLLSTIFLLMWCLYISFLMGNKIETVEDLRECIGAGPIAVIPMCKQLKNEDQTDEKTRN